jgi:hypothetical protein
MKEGIIKHMNDLIDYHSEELKKVEDSLKSYPDECLLKIDRHEHSTKIQLCKAIITNINEGIYG